MRTDVYTPRWKKCFLCMKQADSEGLNHLTNVKSKRVTPFQLVCLFHH